MKKEFQTSKFFCKTDFNMEEISNEEKDYANYPLPKYYNFSSVEARERSLYANFLKVKQGSQGYDCRDTGVQQKMIDSIR